MKDEFYIAVCQAMALLNQSIGSASDEQGLQAKNILREALFNYKPSDIDEHKLTGTYYPESDYDKYEGKIPPVNSIESTSEALLVASAPAWISVKAGKPKHGTWVLAYNNGHVVRGFYHGDWFNEYNQSTMDIHHAKERITHWMPLPAPPKD